MTSQLTRLVVTILITVLLLQACVGCTTTKAKQTRTIAVDSTYRAIRIDSSTVLHKYEGLANSNDKYERVTTITPTIIHDKDTIIIRPTTIIREVGERVTEVRYIDSSAGQRRVMENELAELKKQVREKTKEKNTKPDWLFWVLASCVGGLFIFAGIRGYFNKKAT